MKIEIDNTSIYKVLGTIILIISLISGLILITDFNNIILGSSIIGIGLYFKILFQIVYSICYRLDLIIQKNK